MLTNCGSVADERDCVFICAAGRGNVEEGGGTLELQSIMLHSSARPSHHFCHCIRFKLQEQIYLKTSSPNMWLPPDARVTQEGGNRKQAHYHFTALLIICIFNGCHMAQKSFQLKQASQGLDLAGSNVTFKREFQTLVKILRCQST